MWIVTKEAITGIVRTGVSYLYALLLMKVPVIDSWLMDNGLSDGVQTFISGAFVLFAGTVVYSGIRWAAEKWPQVGLLLIFNTKPSYEE